MLNVFLGWHTWSIVSNYTEYTERLNCPAIKNTIAKRFNSVVFHKWAIVAVNQRPAEWMLAVAAPMNGHMKRDARLMLGTWPYAFMKAQACSLPLPKYQCVCRRSQHVLFLFFDR